MARIRSVKPELRTSRTVASWPFEVRYFFVLLWGYLDDKGRGLDNPKTIAGDCFPHDEKITAQRVDRWLTLMSKGLHGKPGPVCRYEVNGCRYVHTVNCAEHQRPNRPTPSRLPPCPLHESFSESGGDSLREAVTDATADGADSSPNGLLEHDSDSLPTGNEVTGRSRNQEVTNSGGSATRPPRKKPQVGPSRLTEPPPGESVPGIRSRGAGEQGVPTSSGAEPAPHSDPDTAAALIGEWLDRCQKRPPEAVIGQIGKHLRAMLGEGQDPADLRRGLAAWMAKGLHPAALPSVVNEVMNRRPEPRPAPIPVADQRIAALQALKSRPQPALPGGTP